MVFLLLELWDLFVSVFGSVSVISNRTGQLVQDVKEHHKSKGKINVVENIDSVPYISNRRVKEFCRMCLKTLKQR